MDKIVVVMATHNAEKYILEQLNSIYNQTISNFDLIIHDDESNDNTIKIIKEFIKNKKNMKLLNDGIVFHSACGNFFHLLNYIKNKDYDFICFSDQDDIWYENHIEILLNEIKKMPTDLPCLVHGDSCVVDLNNEIISPSFNKYANIRMHRTDFYSIALHNNTQGSSMMINKKVLKYIPKNLDKIYMYDSYISCITSLYGLQKYLNIPLLRYRQHNNNVIGSEKTRNYFEMLNYKKFKNYINIVKEGLRHSLNQQEALLNNDNNNKKIKNEIKMIKSGFFQKLIYVYKYKIIENLGIKSTLGFLICNSRNL